ncbi:MAG: energy transducer TonB [Bacteroides sp.]|nr:energy transducer TonB [Bacteroides sp.]
MEVKKTKKANLENKKSSWLLAGYVTALAALFVAFEWSKRDVTIDLDSGIAEMSFAQDLEIPITEQQPTPPPPPVKAPEITDMLTIVDNEAEVEEVNIVGNEELGGAVEIKYTPPVPEEEETLEDEIFVIVEEAPEFQEGGMAGLMKYLSTHIKYPPHAQENNIQGKVTVQFVVNKDGSIVDVAVMRGVDPYLDREALRVISSMPKWKPGRQRGQAVRCKFTVPVIFKLQ